MTDELFYRDGYLSEFEAEVTAIHGDYVTLGGTAFFPGGGGQVSDIGVIGGVKVTEVKQEKGEIIHKVPGHDFKVGDRIWCSVDWNRRYDLMKGHTAEHLLFASLLREDSELENVKIFVSPEAKYLVVNKDLPWEKITNAVRFANKAIQDNLTVSRTVMSKNDPDISKIRVKIDSIEDDEFSVISIGDLDVAACCGVHVMETSELIAISVEKKVSAGKGNFEIHFKVGSDAINDLVDLSGSCHSIIDILGSKPKDVEKAVINMKEELETAKEEIKATISSSIKSTVPEKVNGVDFYHGIFHTSDRKQLTDFAERVKSDGGVAAIVCVGSNLNVILASGVPKVDCKNVLSEVLSSFDGRGGGKSDFSQGGIQDVSVAEKVMGALISKVSESL